MINVIIADDHPVVRAGMKQILLEAGDVLAVAETGSGEELIREVRSHDFDVVLLDITMPGIGGLETLKRLKALKPELPVLMLSVHSEDQFALRTMKAGAAGYLTKESAPAELVKAIRQVVGGRSFISPEFAEKLATELHQGINRLPHERLSDREMQVLCMMAAGKTASGIAAALNLSVKTVSTYRARIIEKTGMATNAELIAYAVKNNIC
jgi:two-component system, NarL family, invasion response regulator UvrY